MELLANGARKLGISLNHQQIENFQLFYDELVEWNKRTNITGISDYAGVQTKHFLDSLSIILFWKPLDQEYVLDVGSGPGLPGLPLKIVFPSFKLVLLEATGKKVTFLNHVITKLGVKDVEIIKGRAEELAHNMEYREKFDIVLARAVAELPSLVELALPFCKTGGTFISSKKNDISDELTQAGKAISLLGGRFRSLVKVNLPEFTDNRCLVVIDKVEKTPDQYPRRPGIPQRRPIKS